MGGSSILVPDEPTTFAPVVRSLGRTADLSASNIDRTHPALKRRLKKAYQLKAKANDKVRTSCRSAETTAIHECRLMRATTCGLKGSCCWPSCAPITLAFWSSPHLLVALQVAAHHHRGTPHGYLHSPARRGHQRYLRSETNTAGTNLNAGVGGGGDGGGSGSGGSRRRELDGARSSTSGGGVSSSSSVLAIVGGRVTPSSPRSGQSLLPSSPITAWPSAGASAAAARRGLRNAAHHHPAALTTASAELDASPGQGVVDDTGGCHEDDDPLTSHPLGTNLAQPVTLPPRALGFVPHLSEEAASAESMAQKLSGAAPTSSLQPFLMLNMFCFRGSRLVLPSPQQDV